MRHVWLLAVAQALAACGSGVFVLAGGLLGTGLAPRESLATLPVSLLVIGIAAAALPAGALMRRVGRRAAFVGSALGGTGALLGAGAAVAADSFAGFCAAAFALGFTLAFVQQYRFAAVELAPPGRAGRAVSTVMIGTLVAAWAGPALAVACRDLWPEHPWAGSFVVVALLNVAAAAVLRVLPLAPPSGPVAEGPARPFAVVAADPRYRVAVLGGVSAFAVMSFLMTATPISMHVLHGHDLAATAWVIQSHLLAMYLPALASGWFVERLGAIRMMHAGAWAMAGCVAIAAIGGHEVAHYWWALVLLGVGWNFLFVGSTTLLTTTYRPAERFAAQSANDFAVFGSQAIASLAAGALVHRLGWEQLNLAAAPLLALLLLALVLASRRHAEA
ncbi:MAG: MFS transporter [Steroidobacteraceae bacterium]|nr:MFS transporter [Steroidobacteraceae bacterium]